MAHDLKGTLTLESMSTAVWYNLWVLEKFKNYLKGDILEVGCGIGNFTRQLTEFGKTTAIDIQADYIPDLKGELKKTVRVGYGDIEAGKYFFGKKKFDVIVCLNVLEHIHNDRQAFENMTNLLKRNGYLIVLVPSGMNLYGSIDKAIGHFRRYTKNQVVELFLKLKLQVIFARKMNLLGGLGWFVAGKIFKNQIVKQDQLKLFNFLAPFVLNVENLIEPPFGTSILVIGQKK